MLALVCISYASTAFFIIRHNSESLEHHMVDDYSDLSELVSKQIELGYITYALPFEMLSKLSASEDFEFWWIVKSDGAIFLANDDSFSGRNANSLFPKTADGIFFDKASHSGVVVKQLDIKDNRKYWSFWLGFSTKQIESSVKQNIATFLTMFIVSGFLLVAIVSVLAFKIRKPIYELMRAANAVAKGNLNYAIKPQGDDEIKQLAGAFNEMRLGLKDRNDLLNSLLKTFKGKFGKIAGIIVRKNVQELADKNPRILKIVPAMVRKTIKERERKRIRQ